KSKKIKFKIKKNDDVVVISGSDKGKSGKVLDVNTLARKVTVEAVAVARKHVRPSPSHSGGIVSKNLFIDVSNVKKLKQ
ncbi:MAG: 50S ribosomal protein L24, partial [Rickettsiales bacterium]